MNSHLAAHQNKTEKRNDDVAEVLAGIQLGKAKVDILNQFHHVFWMGDLNYRCAKRGVPSRRRAAVSPGAEGRRSRAPNAAS